MLKKIISNSAIIIGVGIGVAIALNAGGRGHDKVATSGQNTIVSGKAAIGGAYTPVDHTGKTEIN